MCWDSVFEDLFSMISVRYKHLGVLFLWRSAGKCNKPFWLIASSKPVSEFEFLKWWKQEIKGYSGCLGSSTFFYDFFFISSFDFIFHQMLSFILPLWKCEDNREAREKVIQPSAKCFSRAFLHSSNIFLHFRKLAFQIKSM